LKLGFVARVKPRSNRNAEAAKRRHLAGDQQTYPAGQRSGKTGKPGYDRDADKRFPAT
jgi:hypothetical protein